MTPGATAPSRTPAEAMRRLFLAWEHADPDGLAALFTDDGIYDDPLKPRRLIGRGAVREGNARAMAAITDCRIEVRSLIESGDLAACEGFFAARLVDGTGRLDFPFMATVEVRGGLIARVSEYFDTGPLRAGG